MYQQNGRLGEPQRWFGRFGDKKKKSLDIVNINVIHVCVFVKNLLSKIP